jgi:alpha-D-ribose 1-methylphosphonate 5-triphosphate diphosphatase
LCHVLASDYYYPAPLAAAFKLDAIGALPLARAWELVSKNPARAAGLDDRGSLVSGQRADAIIVDDRVPGLPRVCAAIVGGRLQYANRHWPMITAPESALSGQMDYHGDASAHDVARVA